MRYFGRNPLLDDQGKQMQFVGVHIGSRNSTYHRPSKQPPTYFDAPRSSKQHAMQSCAEALS
jgi:hypothetical protein